MLTKIALCCKKLYLVQCQTAKNSRTEGSILISHGSRWRHATHPHPVHFLSRMFPTLETNKFGVSFLLHLCVTPRHSSPLYPYSHSQVKFWAPASMFNPSTSLATYVQWRGEICLRLHVTDFTRPWLPRECMIIITYKKRLPFFFPCQAVS